jgi:hypothetical protein
LHPSVVTHPDFLQWIGRRAADTFEDVVLGLVPGLVGLRTRRTRTLVASAAVAAWLSLPFLVIANTLIAGHVGGVWTALTTRVGDWDEPVDPGLFVYALLTGAFTAFCIAPATRRPRRTFGIGLGLAAAGLALIGLGAHY